MPLHGERSDTIYETDAQPARLRYGSPGRSGRNSVVECQLPKLDVVGSNPIARSIFLRVGPANSCCPLSCTSTSGTRMPAAAPELRAKRGPVRAGWFATAAAAMGLGGALGCVGSAHTDPVTGSATSADLRVPLADWVATLAQRDRAGFWHVVQTGETLHSVARQYGVTLWRLCHYNGLSQDARLAQGQWVFIVPLCRTGPTTAPRTQRSPARH